MPTCELPTTTTGYFSALPLEHIDEAFFAFNTRFEIEYLNGRAKQLAKKIYGREVIPGHSILEYGLGSRTPDFKKVLKRVLNGEEMEYEIQVQNSDIWLHCKYFPATNEAGEITGIYGLLKDTTAKRAFGRLEQKAGMMEQDLFESRLLFEQFMQNSPLISWVNDRKGVMHYMNPVLLKVYGYTKNDFGKTIFELFDAPLAIEYHMNNQRVLKGGKAIETIEKGKTANGEMQVLKVYKFPLTVDGEVMIGGWAVDVTDQVELQEKLMKTVERQEYVNEATSDAIYDWNINTGRIHRGTAFETVFGHTEKDVSMKTRLTLVHPEDYEHYKQHVFDALRNEKEDKWKIQYRYKAGSGEYKTVVDKAFIIRSVEDKAIRVIGAMQDITAQVELQELLIRQQIQAKQEVIKSIIETQEKERRQLSVELHDNVNQMLASCKLMLEVAIENGGNAQMLTQKSYQSIQTVINEIRRISHDLNPSAIVDVGLVEAIEQMVEKINFAGKIKIQFQADRRKYTSYLTEEDKIAVFRIVQEQLNNILKHARATEVSIKLEMVDGVVRLSIKDNGVGFDPATCKRGLGLRNIYNRVEYYGGTIQVNAAKGQGVEMSITLQTTQKMESLPQLKIA